MATKISVDAKRGDVLGVDPFDVTVIEGCRGRHYPPTPQEVINKALSFVEHGQLTPVECRLDTERKPILTFGFTRTAAARLLRTGFKATDVEGKEQFYQKEDFLLQIKIVNCNESEARVHNILENAQRNDTSDVDDAHNQEWLRRDRMMSDADIARMYGWTISEGKPNVGRVGRLKRLLLLPDPIQKLVHEDEVLNTTGALQLLDLPEEERESALATLMAGASDNGNGKVKVTAAAIKSHVRGRILNDDKEAASNGDGEGEKVGAEIQHPPARALLLSTKEMRKFWQGLVDDESTDPAVAAFAQDIMLWMSGKKGDKAMKNAIGRLLDAKKSRR